MSLQPSLTFVATPALPVHQGVPAQARGFTGFGCLDGLGFQDFVGLYGFEGFKGARRVEGLYPVSLGVLQECWRWVWEASKQCPLLGGLLSSYFRFMLRPPIFQKVQVGFRVWGHLGWGPWAPG